jgi:hypothetical protein
VAETIMPKMAIPIIGIGAGPSTDGQVLVFHDLLGIREGRGAKFVKRYADLLDEMTAGVAPTPPTCASAGTPAPSTGTRCRPRSSRASGATPEPRRAGRPAFDAAGRIPPFQQRWLRVVGSPD